MSLASEASSNLKPFPAKRIYTGLLWTHICGACLLGVQLEASEAIKVLMREPPLMPCMVDLLNDKYPDMSADTFEGKVTCLIINLLDLHKGLSRLLQLSTVYDQSWCLHYVSVMHHIGMIENTVLRMISHSGTIITGERLCTAQYVVTEPTKKRVTLDLLALIMISAEGSFLAANLQMSAPTWLLLSL